MSRIKFIVAALLLTSPAIAQNSVDSVARGLAAEANAKFLKLAPIPSAVSGTACPSSGDAAAINTLIGAAGFWSIPVGITCTLSAPLAPLNAQLWGDRQSSTLSPLATIDTLWDIGGTTNRSSVYGITFSNLSSRLTSGIHYHNSVGNNSIFVRNSQFFNLPNGFIDDAAYPGGDFATIAENFFLNNITDVNFANVGTNSSVHGNSHLGSTLCYNFSQAGGGGNHNEGTRVYDNSCLSAVGSAVSVTAGLEFQFFGNIFDQSAAHSVILDASTYAISAVKFGFNSIGASATIAAGQDGFHVIGGVEYVPIIANTIVGWTGYGINFASGVQHAPIIGNKFYNNITADALFNNTAGVTLISNYFGSTASWIESGSTTTMAFGNRCATPATISSASLVLGDQTCGPNQIPSLFVTGDMTASGSLVFGQNGSSGPGTLYSDNNWGLIVKAKQASPGAADFAFTDASGNQLLLLAHTGSVATFNTGMKLVTLAGTGSRPICVTSTGVIEAGSLAAGLVTCP